MYATILRTTGYLVFKSDSVKYLDQYMHTPKWNGIGKRIKRSQDPDVRTGSVPFQCHCQRVKE